MKAFHRQQIDSAAYTMGSSDLLLWITCHKIVHPLKEVKYINRVFIRYAPPLKYCKYKTHTCWWLGAQAIQPDFYYILKPWEVINTAKKLW